MTKEMRISQIK